MKKSIIYSTIMLKEACHKAQLFMHQVISLHVVQTDIRITTRWSHEVSSIYATY